MRRTRSMSAVGVALAAAAAAVLGAPAAEGASSPIQLRTIQFDSPGSDGGSNASLNAEYVQIKNTGAKNVSLAGWTLRDASSHVFTFPSSYTLKAGRTVTVRTGSGSSGSATRYWGEDWYVWNNTGDKATLKKANGTVADTCAWKSKGSGSIAC